ncbi:hypothetical protein M758_1G114700 [Ceratodon purpureus]|nr:hypothetical protein M758_1G114700 [Ceratodon purpureus]
MEYTDDHTGEPSWNAEERDLAYANLQVLRAMHWSDMNELYERLSIRSTQPAEQLQDMEHDKDVLLGLISNLQTPKELLPKDFNSDDVDEVEMQIINIMETFKMRGQPTDSGEESVQADNGTPSPRQNSCLTKLSNNQGGISVGESERDIVYSKLQVLKATHMEDMKLMSITLSECSTRWDMPPERLEERLEELESCKDMHFEMLAFLQLSKEQLPEDFNRNHVDTFGRKIIGWLEHLRKKVIPGDVKI